MHIESLVGIATAAAATGTAVTAGVGDSLTVKNAKPGTKIMMLAAWVCLNTNGFAVQLTRPTGHDTTRGFRAVGKAATVGKSLIGASTPLDLKAQELMSVTLFGAATAGDIEVFHSLIWYEDLPGTSARLAGAPMLNRIEDVLTIQASITSAAGGGYQGAELINAESDLLQANRDYVVLGATSISQVHSGALTIVGPDTGNLKVAIPLCADEHYSANFLAILAQVTGKPTMPIIAAGNKTSTYIGAVCNENGAAFNASLHLGLLA
jgi:hypothetical protein